MPGSFRLAFLGLLCTSLTVLAADGPIRLPVAPVIPSPMPTPPEPGAVLRLTADTLYMVDADSPVIVLTSPPGLVSVSEESGPLKVRGKFVDGLGKTETRTFKGKQVFTLEAVGTGRVEVLVVPVGATKAADVIRRVIDVDSGTAPLPPPPKPVDPKVDPVDPVAPIPVAGLRVLIVYESADASKMPPAQSAILYGAKSRDWLNTNCVVGPDGKTKEFRIWDQDVATEGESKLWQDAMKRPRKSVPWLLVSNGVSGFEGPLPADVDAFLVLVEKFKGGK